MPTRTHFTVLGAALPAVLALFVLPPLAGFEASAAEVDPVTGSAGGASADSSSDSPGRTPEGAETVAPDTLGKATPPAAMPTAAPTPTPPPGRVRLELYPQALESDPPPRNGPLVNGDEVSLTVEEGVMEAPFWGRYNRVEGLSLHGGIRRRLDRRSFLPSYHADLGYAFSADRSQYAVGFEQPLAPRNKVTVGASAFRRFLPFFYNDEAVGSGENTASALFLHRDYWDWYEAEGLQASLALRTSPFFSIRLGITSQDESSLRNNTDWSLFRPGGDFRGDPLSAEGEYRGLGLLAAYDGRPRKPDGGPRPRSSWGGVTHWHRIAWERADAGLGGDFDLWRVHADLRTYVRLSARQALALRVLAGKGEAANGFLPAQRRFAVGGLGTLRGHNFRALSGDRVALVNLEYAFSLGHTNHALFFVDAGTAWDGGDLRDQFVPVDVGTGLRLGEDGLTLLVARSVNDSDAEVKVQLRLRESF